MAIPLPANETVARTPNGEETRVVAISFLQKDLQCPIPSADNGKTRCPIAEHRTPCNIFQNRFGAPNRIAELIRRNFRHLGMVGSVRSDFVSTRMDLTNETRLSLGDPPEHKKSPARSVFRQEVEQTMNAQVNTPGDRVPGAAWSIRRESRNLEILLHINRKVVCYWRVQHSSWSIVTR